MGQREVSKGTLCLLSDLVFGRGLPKSRSYPGKQDSVLPSCYLGGQPLYLVSLRFLWPLLHSAHFPKAHSSCSLSCKLSFLQRHNQGQVGLPKHSRSFSMVIDLGFLLVAHNRYLSCAGFNIKSLDSGVSNTPNLSESKSLILRFTELKRGSCWGL